MDQQLNQYPEVWNQISDNCIYDNGEQKDAQQMSRLRQQLQDVYEYNEGNKVNSQIKQKGRSESLNNGYKKPQPLIEFQDFRSGQKKNKICRVLKETGNNFYGPIQQTQVNKKISSIKDSIASGYLQKESSLSPFIQIYLKQALKLQIDPKKVKQQGLMVKNNTFESEESLNENNSENRDISIADYPQKKSNFLTQTNNIIDTEVDQQENNLISSQVDQNYKSFSPVKNKSSFIKDKLERMHTLSGDYLIEEGLKKVKDNLQNALNDEYNSVEDDSMEIIGEINTSQEKLRNNLKKKYQRNNQRIKTATDEDFYSRGHPKNLSFYDNNNNTKTHTRYTLDSNRLKTETSEMGNHKKYNNFWPTSNFDQQKKVNLLGEYQGGKSKETDLTLQGSFQEQTSKISKPQRAQSQGPKSGQAIQCIFYNADPNNTMLKDFFGDVDSINLNNIFVNQLGITDEQKHQMLEKMDPETKQQILRKYAVQDRIFKFTKFSNFHSDEFYDSFKNNYQFIQEESQKNDYPASCMHIKQLQKSQNSSVSKEDNKRSISNQRKRVIISNQADPETLSRFQTPINLSRLVGHSRVRTENDVLADIGYLQPSKVKKENPLYINRINRVRLQSYSSSKAQRHESSSLDPQRQERVGTASKNENSSQHIKSFIDPRKVYRQNLEIYAQQNQNLKSLNTQFTEQYLAATAIKKVNQSEESNQKVFFQNQDLKRRLQISNLNINV